MCLTLVRTGYLNVKSCYHYQNTSTSLGQRKLGRNVPVGADVKKSLNFDCPEEFGYYPHPADCTQYYVCVFGGALLESCTGGLMYSHELQTCDWPRNVGCDGTGDVVTTPSVAYVSSTPSRSADSKIRYSHPPPPPPIPPQPAAVVTSRGQPRQLQHSQQELIKQKQQQQLYVDADDTLSPAEEIESDRQQRVYRGQPSTVGQVQRDRDGLRQHTNAIPLSSGRGEKISIISFSGQQQQQPIQQYSETDDDDHLTNSLTTIIHNRYKRQLGRSQNYAGGSIHVIAAQAFPNGQPSASPSFQSYLAPYRTDITNSRDRSVEILPSTLANNNYQRITLSNLRSNNYDQNYQYYHLHHHNIPQLPDAKPVNHKAQLTLNYNTNGFVPSLHFPILGKQPRAPDLDTFTQTRGSIALFRKPTTTEFIPISKRPDSIYKQYLTVNTDRPKNISALYTPNNNSFNILSFIDYLKQPLSGHLISIPQYSGTNLTKNTNPKIEIYADSPVTKITSGTSHLKQVLALTNNPTKFNTNEDFRETIRPSTSSKMLAQNYSYYDEYYDYPNETEYYDDDLNLLTLNRSYPLKNSSVTTTTPLPKITKVKPPLAKLHNTQRNTGSSTTITSPFARISTTVRQTTESGHRLSTTHRIENKGNRAIEQTLSTVPPKTIYNNSNNYDSSRYDSYYALYDDDVDIYKDVEYAQHYNNEPTPKQVYRGTPATVTHEVIQQEKSPKISNSGYIQNTYSASDDIYQPADVQSYSDDVSYGTQDDERTVYHQTSKQTNRGDRNELNYIEESATTKRITTTTTTTPASTPREYSTQKNIRNPARVTNNRGRGSAHYTTSGRNDNSVNRGTPPSRSRPTLKPSTSVVAKAAEFIDIYKYPPRRPEPIYPQPLPDKTAAKCRKDVCLLPDCSCGGKEIPGDLPVEQVPQMVLLTYDDSVNDLNKGLYSDLFEKGRVNPNGCPIAATFYVSHEWTDYSQVQNLYSDGHEIASHTVSHSFGEQFSQKKWTKEVAGQREILSAYGGVHLEDVRGMRAPFLSVGGNKMFKMLYDSNFTFDSSMPIYENKPPSWPYTLDYKLFHDCMIPPCPTRSYPGVWEVPMVMWQDLNGGRCSMGDACSNPSDAEGVYKMIMKNFERHYTSNRAPFGLFYHAAWFTQPHHKEGFIQFLDAINSMKDVWLVTNWQAIQWVRDPTPTSRLNSFQPFGCNYPDRPKRCNNPKVCNLWHKTGVRYMRTCQPCPDIYPWTGNTGIHSSRIDNDLEE
ncbi:uncharacterized protein LOC116166626 isoform X5 [Photinus pyralis]|uniref:uncharacterized protein LOC116166626 isoform X5 n=1 Tax=Photinus pyralis TaxID=7054 RepID=UPI0012677400|nr:uncharacterized protein LOC116166626 isoform X5 [Photinus pyralis]